MSIKELRQKMSMLEDEVDWWRAYGEYVSRVYKNIDAEASGYADGDDEYKDNFNKNADNL